MRTKKGLNSFEIFVFEYEDNCKVLAINTKDFKFRFLAKDGFLSNSTLAYRALGRKVCKVSYRDTNLKINCGKRCFSFSNLDDITDITVAVVKVLNELDKSLVFYFEEAFDFISNFTLNLELYKTDSFNESRLDNISEDNVEISSIMLYGTLGKFSCVIDTMYGRLCLTGNSANPVHLSNYLQVIDTFSKLDCESLKLKLFNKLQEELVSA